MKKETADRKEAEAKEVRKQNIEQNHQTRIEEKRKLRPNEAAEFLGVKEGTLSQWRHFAIGPAYIKTGGKVFYKKADLEAFERRIER